MLTNHHNFAPVHPINLKLVPFCLYSGDYSNVLGQVLNKPEVGKSASKV